MTQISSDGTVVVTDNTSSASNSTSGSQGVKCDGQSMYTGGLVVVVVSLLFFVTMCWRICREPQTMMVFRANTLPQAVSTSRAGAADAENVVSTRPAVEPGAVELTMQ